MPATPTKKKKITRKGSTGNSSTVNKKRQSSRVEPTIIKVASNKKFKVANQLLTFTNPTYDDQDLEYFEDSWANTPAGTAIDKKTEFVIGGEIKPTLEIINPVNDAGEELTDEQKQNVISTYDDLLNELMDIDRDVKINQNVFDAFVMAKVFGRAAILFDHDQTDEQSARGIPVP